MTRDELLDLAVDRWGSEAQLRQLQEECAELIVAVNHVARQRPNCLDDVIGEIADVEIMILQARRIFGDRGIDAAVAQKLARLKARLEESK